MESELLARIYREPSALDLRAVYADWLLQQGDDLGELIVLQLTALREELTLKQQERSHGHFADV